MRLTLGMMKSYALSNRNEGISGLGMHSLDSSHLLSGVVVHGILFPFLFLFDGEILLSLFLLMDVASASGMVHHFQVPGPQPDSSHVLPSGWQTAVAHPNTLHRPPPAGDLLLQHLQLHPSHRKWVHHSCTALRRSQAPCTRRTPRSSLLHQLHPNPTRLRSRCPLPLQNLVHAVAIVELDDLLFQSSSG